MYLINSKGYVIHLTPTIAKALGSSPVVCRQGGPRTVSHESSRHSKHKTFQCFIFIFIWYVVFMPVNPHRNKYRNSTFVVHHLCTLKINSAHIVQIHEIL